VRRYLVVANQTLGGNPLVATVRERARREPCTFHLLVPATPPRDHPWTEGEAGEIARERLELALARFLALGVEVDGEVGDASPILAIEDVLRHDDGFDEIILSTLPPGLSRWLKVDLPHRVEAAFGLPVTHVVSKPEPVSSRA
jgi:GABA permease